MVQKKATEVASEHVRIFPSTYEVLGRESAERGVSIAWILREWERGRKKVK